MLFITLKGWKLIMSPPLVPFWSNSTLGPRRKCGDDVRGAVALMPNLVHRSKGALASPVMGPTWWPMSCWMLIPAVGTPRNGWNVFDEVMEDSEDLTPCIKRKIKINPQYKWVPTCSNERRMAMFTHEDRQVPQKDWVCSNREWLYQQISTARAQEQSARQRSISA